MEAAKPNNESDRLKALQEYQLLDSESEQDFDDITSLAAHICGTPIALVVLVDSVRQWFKSRVGLDATETPREFAFCAHAILGQAMLIVEDATTDTRFAQNPLVTSDPHIRFYAGTPLINPDGFPLGTLCVIDRQPRRLTATQVAMLESLKRQVLSQMELRRVAKCLAGALEGVRTLQGLLPICAWCKSIRNDSGYWNQLEEYLLIHTDAEMSHGICPICADRFTSAL